MNGPFHEAGTGQEILLRDPPTKRYGVGVIYPQQQILIDANEGDAGDTPPLSDREAIAEADEPAEEVLVGATASGPDDDDFDLTATSQFRPSAMAVSFLAVRDAGDSIEIRLTGGRYETTRGMLRARSVWYVRRPIDLTFRFASPAQAGVQAPVDTPSTEPLALTARLLARKRPDGWLCTAAIVNTASAQQSAETMSLFQAAFTVSISRAGAPVSVILPYPDPRSARLLDRDPEARSLDLMYRNAPTFGVGHGCAATWDEQWGILNSAAVHATALPSFESPSITPDVSLPDGTSLAVPMGPLAGLDPGDDGFGSIQRLAAAYGTWIDRLKIEAETLTGTAIRRLSITSSAAAAGASPHPRWNRLAVYRPGGAPRIRPRQPSAARTTASLPQRATGNPSHTERHDRGKRSARPRLARCRAKLARFPDRLHCCKRPQRRRWKPCRP